MFLHMCHIVRFDISVLLVFFLFSEVIKYVGLIIYVCAPVIHHCPTIVLHNCPNIVLHRSRN